jgi:hypothetical protein
VAAGAVHVATGYAVGSHAGTVVGGFVAGFVSHAVFDAVPHHDYKTPRSAAIDLAAGGVIAAAMIWRTWRSKRRLAPALAGAFGAAVPDFENVAWFLGYIGRDQRKYPSHGGPIVQYHASYAATGAYYAIAVVAAWLVMAKAPSKA